MARFSKLDRVMQIVAGVFVILGGIAIVFLVVMVEDAFPMIFFAIIMFIMGPVLILLGALGVSKINKAEKKAASLRKDASSLAYLTYGGNGGYRHYSVIQDKEGQDAANTGRNVAGIASLVLLGAGAFTSGYNFIDCFISENEIILNNKVNNPGLEDKLFKRFNADVINDIIVETDINYVKAIIMLADGKRATLHIPHNTNNVKIIQSDFFTIKTASQQIQDFNTLEA